MFLFFLCTGGKLVSICLMIVHIGSQVKCYLGRFINACSCRSICLDMLDRIEVSFYQHIQYIIHVYVSSNKGFVGLAQRFHWEHLKQEGSLETQLHSMLFSLFTLLLYCCSSTFIFSQHNMFRQVIFTHIYSLSLAESSCPKKQGFSFILVGCVQ